MLCIGIYTLLKLVCICVGEAASCSLKCLFPLGTWLPTRTDLWSYLELGKVMFSSAECEQKYWLPLLGPGLPCEIYLLHTHLPFFLDFFFFYVDHFKSLYWICYNIALGLSVCFFWPWGMWDLSCLTRDRTPTSCTGMWSLNHWTTR